MNAAGPPPPAHPASPASSHTLPVGTRLRDFEITGLIGEGGFGVVYLAYDHSLLRRVAIKEYMPSSMASRAVASLTVIVKSERHLETFGAGLRSFVNEARLLARFDHPSLVKVYRFWEENGTAYMAMPYYEGPTLKHALAQMGRPASEAELRAWLRPLLDALAVMHAARCYHRDIAPDNILLTATGPLLLDFGAARRVIGDMTHALTVVLKPGYAPIEQYGDVATMAQGAWTDLYALACVVYFAIQGKPPMSSVERLMADALEPLNTAASGLYSEPFLHAIDKALSVRPQDRPQSVAEFRDLLDGRSSSAPPAVGFAETASSALDPEGFQATLPPGMWSPPQVTLPPPVPGAGVTFAPDSSMLGTTIVRPATARFQATSPASAPAPVTVPEAVPTQAPISALLPAAPPAALPAAPLVAPPVVVPAADSPAGLTAEPSPIAQAPSVAAQTPAWSPPPVEAPPPAPTSPSTPVASRSRKAPLAIVASLAAAALIGAFLYVLTRRAPSALPDAARPASSAASAAPASAAAPTTVTTPVPTAPPVTAPTPSPAASPTTPAPSAPQPASQAASVPAPRAPASSAVSTAKPRREPTSRPAETAPKPDTSATRSQCSDILQKASLEPLTASEAAFLRRECR